MKPRIIRSDEHIKIIKRLYPHTDTAALAERLGYTKGQIIDFAYKNGIKKTEKYRSEAAADNARRSGGAFKKDESPYNTRPIGSTRKNFRGDIVIKVAEPSTWITLKQKVWEEGNGPLPKDHIILFKDGNRENCSPDNLLLMSKKDLLLKHSVHNLPPEIKEVVQLRGNILRCITVRRRKENDK